VVRYEVTERQNEHVVLRLIGRLVGETSAEAFRRSLERHYVDDGVMEIRVDLWDVEEISLEGIAQLLALRRESQNRGKRFVIVRPRGQVREKLEITGTLKPLQDKGDG
jgi:anti-anti-sigma factor